MCGIAGILCAAGAPVARADIAAMVAALAHRGPDGCGIRNQGSVAFGHRRLAVIDPSPAADQPMVGADDEVWLVFNGEIYDFQALRRELVRAGRSFRTRCDTEVILEAYLAWGDDFIDRLDGMFAIAIWDGRDRRLRLYRDRPGIKPLYWTFDGRVFAFASELKAIERLSTTFDLQIDPTAAWDFLTYRYVPCPKTLYRDVHKLPPAQRLVFDLDAGRVECNEPYWQLQVRPEAISVDDAAGEFRRLTEQAVDQQLVADVPVGFFLSGGLDSSTLVALAAERHQTLSTFSIGFDDPAHTETRFARLVAERFRTDHHEAILDASDTAELFGRLRTWYGEPFGDSSAFPTYLVSQWARQSVTVALSGDGADELFGGYRWYRLFERLRPLARGWGRPVAASLDRSKQRLGRMNPLRRACNLLSLVGADDLELYAKLMGGMGRAEKWRYRAVLDIDPDYDDYWHFRRWWRDDLPLRTRLQYLDFHTFLPDDVLTKVDRASMTHGLEVRVPFLSLPLVDFAFGLPETVRYHRGRLKGLMRHAVADVLPAAIIGRSKRGFSAPPCHETDLRRRFQETVLAKHFGIAPREHRSRAA
jgi:asparagine synthase (glutamine-hydrolysing)